MALLLLPPLPLWGDTARTGGGSSTMRMSPGVGMLVVPMVVTVMGLSP